MPLKKLDEGVYSINIQVTQGGLKSEKDFSFNIIWPHKPFSLSNAHIALDALKLIASKEEIKQFSAASDDEFENELRTFWQKHSPDTTQAYNPVMAEFYRRVDEAIKRFSTTVERDGYNTDRGNIYILFGALNIVNRLLKPNTVPTEIWTYEKLKKRYIFKDQKKNGNFILVETENI